MLRPNRSSKGQALIAVALMAVVLFGFSALAIDGSRVFADKRNAQNAADTAALAAALAKVRGQNLSTPALLRASQNGYKNDGILSVVQINNPPISGQFAGNSEYIQVIITSNVPTTFARILGWSKLTNVAEAITHATPGSTSSSGGGAGSGLTALKQNGTGISFTGSGDVTIQGSISDNAAFTSTGSGNFNVTDNIKICGGLAHTGSGDWNVGGNVWSNGFIKTGSQTWNIGGSFFSDGNFSQTGSGEFETDDLTVVGTFTNTGSGEVEPWPPTHGAYVTPPVIADPFASILNPPSLPSTTCQTISYSGSTNHTLNAGCYTGISQTGSGNLTLNSGIYYITTNGISSSGSGNITANGVLLYIKGGAFSMNGNGNLNISPMTSGDYAWLTVYMDRANTNSYSMNGSGNSNFSGTVYAPSSAVTITGSGSTAVIDSQIICSTSTLTGSGNLNLIYNPNHNYQPFPPSSPSIELSQ